MLYASKDIRNVCLVGPSNSGKTQLAEALLYAGGVTGDLSSMRGMVSRTETIPDNRIIVSGQVPLKEIQEYHSRLKSLSGGEGSFTMDFSHYAEVSAAAIA